MGKSTVVFGGGTIAARKIAHLYEAGAHITVISPTITSSISHLLGTRVKHYPRIYQSGDCLKSWLVVAATNDPAVNASIVQECDSSQIWCIRVDHGNSGSAISLAQGENLGGKIAVFTGNPKYSVELKNYLLTQISHYSVQQHALEAKDNSLAVSALAGTVALIGAGPGAADLITLRGERLLRYAQVIIADRLGSRELLSQIPSDVLIIDAGKIPHSHNVSQEHINVLMVHHAQAGKFVVRLKGGDPYIFGRGYEELLYLQKAGIPVQVVPGLSSAISVPTLANLPLSFRGINHDILIISAHFDPDDARSLLDWSLIAQYHGTLVILMGVTHLCSYSHKLISLGKDPLTPMMIIENGSTQEEKITYGVLEDFLAHSYHQKISSPAIIVLGKVVELITRS